MSTTTTISIGERELAYVREFLRAHSAVTLEAGKEWFVESRLAPLADEVGVRSARGVIDEIRKQPFCALHQRVLEALMTNETSFFRDFYPFEALQKRLLPGLIERRGAERKLQIWSAACASGQEPYSIAMLLRDSFPLLSSWNVRIVASDISGSMIRRTRDGVYNQVEVNRGLPAPMLVKFFEKRGKSWLISERIRSMVELRELNLADDSPPLSSLDLIFLRNVLIYFDANTKRAILEKLARVLRPDGYLFLGSAETTINLAPVFEPFQVERTICYRLRSK